MTMANSRANPGNPAKGRADRDGSLAPHCGVNDARERNANDHEQVEGADDWRWPERLGELIGGEMANSANSTNHSRSQESLGDCLDCAGRAP